MSIGENIKSKRIELGFSQDELASAAGVGDVWGYELNKITPSLSVLMKLSIALHCELGDLIYDKK